MKLSIIIPTLNEADNIEQTLHHLQTLRQRGHEIIVVDGGSQDNTLVLTQGLVDKLMMSECGRARQMNAGAEAATGDILIFLHADTRLPPDADEVMPGATDNQLPGWGRFDVQFDDHYWMFAIIALFMNWRSRLTGIATGDQAIFISSGLFQSTGGFPDQPLMEDIELSKRLSRQQRPLCLTVKVVTSSRRWRRHGVIRTVLLMWWIRCAYFFGASPVKLARHYAGK
jgi:rSAM/selenodomain-associated transferase 2